jgi:hypothetical protein
MDDEVREKIHRERTRDIRLLRLLYIGVLLC